MKAVEYFSFDGSYFFIYLEGFLVDKINRVNLRRGDWQRDLTRVRRINIYVILTWVLVGSWKLTINW